MSTSGERGDPAEVEPFLGRAGAREVAPPKASSGMKDSTVHSIGLAGLIFALSCMLLVFAFLVLGGAHSTLVVVGVGAAVLYVGLAIITGYMFMNQPVDKYQADYSRPASRTEHAGMGTEAPRWRSGDARLADDAIGQSGVPSRGDGRRSSHHNHHGHDHAEMPAADVNPDDELDDDQLRERLWVKHKDKEHPDFFANLSIAHDGGLATEVHKLSDGLTGRYIGMVMLLAFCLYDSYSIVKNDVELILEMAAGTSTVNPKAWMITGSIINGIVSQPGYYFPGAELICGLEMGVLLMLWCAVLYYIYKSYNADREWKQWLAVSTLWWDVFPLISVYSAMGLLYFVTPAVATAHFFDKMSTVADENGNMVMNFKTVMTIVQFVVLRLLAAILGFDSFLVKYRQASLYVNYPEMTLECFAETGIFLVQLLGIVKLAIFTKERLFTFIFAGEDAIMTAPELAAEDIYNCMLVRNIFREHKFPVNYAIMGSFSDVDFQSMILNEAATGGKMQVETA